MDEATAKTKWCPFVRTSPETDRTWPMTNREERIGDQEQGAVSRCLASGCAAWRWNDPSIGGGFCGLAGAPL